VCPLGKVETHAIAEKTRGKQEKHTIADKTTSKVETHMISGKTSGKVKTTASKATNDDGSTHTFAKTASKAKTTATRAAKDDESTHLSGKASTKVNTTASNMAKDSESAHASGTPAPTTSGWNWFHVILTKRALPESSATQMTILVFSVFAGLGMIASFVLKKFPRRSTEEAHYLLLA
jgi:hypothetical protein